MDLHSIGFPQMVRIFFVALVKESNGWVGQGISPGMAAAIPLPADTGAWVDGGDLERLLIVHNPMGSIGFLDLGRP